MCVIESKEHRYVNYIGYAVCIVLLGVVQFTPFMPKIYGAYPNPILIFVLIAASFERDLIAAIIGLFAGITIDNYSRCGNGVHALLLLISAVICSLMFEKLLQNNIISLFLTASLITAIYSVAENIISSGVSAASTRLFFSFRLPSLLYSLVLILPMYFLFRLVFIHHVKRHQINGIRPPKLKTKPFRTVKKDY